MAERKTDSLARIYDRGDKLLRIARQVFSEVKGIEKRD